MKRILLTVCSIVLVLACVFGLFSCVAGLKDIMNLNDYKNSDAATAREGIEAAYEGIAMLKENEQTYIDGAGTYTDGLAQYTAGQSQLAAAGQQLAEGQALIDANTQAYLEGKEKIEKLESFMPYIESIATNAQNVRDFNKGILGEDADLYLGNLRASVMNLLANSSAVSSISDMIGMDVGSLLIANPTDTTVCANIVAMYYDGLEQLKVYEDGLAALQDGYAQYNAGKQKLAAASVQLAEGDAQLSVFEEGEITLANGMFQLLESMVPTYRQVSFEQTGDSLPEYLAKAWDIEIPALFNENGFDEAAYAAFCEEIGDALYKVDENGEKVLTRDKVMIDLDRCEELCNNAEQYLNDQEADIKAEVFGRIGTYAALAIACILGIIGGIVGLVGGIGGGKKVGKVCGIFSAIFAVAALVVGFVTNFTDYIYPVRIGADGAYAVSIEDMASYQYSGDAQVKAIIIVAIVAVIFAIVACIAKKGALKKAQEEIVRAEVAGAAAAGAASADAAKLEQLESENAELKAMVASLAADVATVKEGE